MIQRTQYNYLFITGSDVFHRRDCKLCLNAASPASIQGSYHYPAAERGQRPCKLCLPEPGLMLVTLPKPNPARKQDRDPERERFLRIAEEPVKARLISGTVITTPRGSILGWCRYALHPGAVTQSILDRHGCLDKACPFLERNPQSPFWPAPQEESSAKQDRKLQRRWEKQQKAQEEQELQALARRWQSLLTELDADMLIVRIAKDSTKQYKIYYVSDNSFPDWDQYTSFLEALRQMHPDFRITLRHIRDTDGHLVTRTEYQNRRKR